MPGKSLIANACLSFALLMTLQGCATQSVSDQNDADPQPGEVVTSPGGVRLQPVSLYGMPEISLGAFYAPDKKYSLVVCDRLRRAVDSAKPLILYLDGQHEAVKLTAEHIESGALCHDFSASVALLERISSADVAMLRLYLNDDAIEQRISGTVSDYLSRPKMLGPQNGIRRFMDALNQQDFQGALVNE